MSDTVPGDRGGGRDPSPARSTPSHGAGPGHQPLRALGTGLHPPYAPGLFAVVDRIGEGDLGTRASLDPVTVYANRG
jgi:hypothetical protein